MLAWSLYSARAGGHALRRALRPSRRPGAVWSAAASCAAYLVLLGAGTPALAKPSAPGLVCQAVPEAADCAGGVPACTLCHDSIEPARWNDFGNALKAQVGGQADFAVALKSALMSSAGDADKDGVSDRDELVRGTAPGKAGSQTQPTQPGMGAMNPRYKVDGYDPAFAFRRVMVLYCGQSPSYEDNQRFAAAPNDEASLRQRLHAQLSTCLGSAYWRGEGLARLADKRIRPLKAAGPDSNIQIGSLRLVIGDYNYDYRMWSYLLTDDPDMRALLTAQYHVVKEADGSLREVKGVLQKSDPEALAGGQLVPDERRAGMLTTQWFLAINTMFSALPRTSAAQAYRSYLGADISSNEGLRPVAGEPLDIDQKGVAEPRCANCHSTLDPLSYAFAEYEGIQISADLKFGAYRPERLPERLPGWNASKQQSMLLNKPVANLVEWGKVAAASDEFKRNMADVFFRHALGREPDAADQADFQAMWRALPADGYSANKLIHRLVDSLSFGGP
jgi:hypothetical protein